MDQHYSAFISYKHAPADSAVALEIQKRLERYHVPAMECTTDEIMQELIELTMPWLSLSQTVQFVLHRNKALLPHLAGAARIFEEEVASVLK